MYGCIYIYNYIYIYILYKGKKDTMMKKTGTNVTTKYYQELIKKYSTNQNNRTISTNSNSQTGSKAVTFIWVNYLTILKSSGNPIFQFPNALKGHLY